jgi:hypothetical protein
MADGLTKELPLTEVHNTEEYWNRSTIKLANFKALVEAADREALQNEGQVSSELIAELSSTLTELCVQMNGILVCYK